MDTIEPINSQLLIETPIDTTPKVAAGRLPFVAFVDAETERALQESTVLLGRSLVMRGGIAKAIDYLSEQRSPNLLMVDISGVDLPLSQIQTLADVCEPGTNVVALGDHNDVGLYRDLQDAGVSHYIVKPLTRELLLKALTPKPNTGEVARPGLKLGKMVSFIGARGGVGTTTLACNLAWYLADRQSRRVALVDLDLQNGDCALLFNTNTTPGLRDALSNPLRIDHLLVDRITTQYGERLFVLGSEEPLFDNLQITTSAIDALLAVLRSQFHYIIVDLPRIPTPAYRRVLEISDRRIIIVDQTMRSMRDGVRLAKLLGDDGVPGAERSAEHRNLFVLNRIGEAGRDSLGLQDVYKVLRVQPVTQIPFIPRLVMPSAHHGQVAASQRGKFANAIATLALELSGRKRKQKWWRRIVR